MANLKSVGLALEAVLLSFQACFAQRRLNETSVNARLEVGMLANK